jgi:flagellar hook assembly protein FlgD
VRASSTIAFSLEAPSAVELAVYGVDGRRVRTLAASRFEAGSHRLVWDGRDQSGHRVAAGVYYVRLHAAGRQWTRSLVVMK